MKHIVYFLHSAPKGNPKHVMNNLGITYQIAIPQSLYDSWHFWNCENLPDSLPKFLQVMTAQPEDAIGYGLSKEDAAAIRYRMQTK